MKRPVYVPQYTHTARNQGHPLHPPSAENITIIDENVEEPNAFNISNTQKNTSHTALISHSIPLKPSGVPTITIFLVILGGVILIASVAAIVLSVVFNLNSTTTSTLSSSNATTTVATTTVITTITTALYTCQNFNVTVNWDYPNNDIASVSPMSFSTCCSWCLSQINCACFALINSSATCYLKTSNGGGGLAAAGKIGASL